MPERIFEVYIDGYVFPDTVTVFLVNDDDTDSRNYVSKGLYEDVCDAIDAWRAENAKLRELVWDMWDYAVNREMELCSACSCADGDFADCSACDEYDDACGIAKKRFEELYAERMCELGIEVNG